ncbi:hypothetical protein NOF04DRAFT_13445 [Fusarium oxysporum II5]|uniref:Zn(2)-C6 fungal-type domain-containing protein n=2 Tax=Fusarium oxysporum species complex TaxID=171631 RepID=X0JBM5_FUSO5|nr:uncharacterized protein FOIG_13309 [Fusarium odoratissimum NRRL 54006]EXL93740.1 hypothetical protein FOIG_13309 [Fusarium odoratissimum NRRL 54006]KAK2134043.1 hypothetical protein NOF04DRAFT_13445 [Fusarium oxysporum II5]TXC07451.1 hypothetical protein FocTR4_00004288 [Fusarium oxysporum f. sp. cubense]
MDDNSLDIGHDTRITKRRRVTLACNFCRTKKIKIKCDGAEPKCSTCNLYGAACDYPQRSRKPEFRPDNSSISYSIRRRPSSCWDISLLKWPTLKEPSKVPWNVWKVIVELITIGTKEFGGTLD